MVVTFCRRSITGLRPEVNGIYFPCPLYIYIIPCSDAPTEWGTRQTEKTRTPQTLCTLGASSFLEGWVEKVPVGYQYWRGIVGKETKADTLGVKPGSRPSVRNHHVVVWACCGCRNRAAK